MFTLAENRVEVIDLSSPAVVACQDDITESLIFEEIEVPSEMFLGCDTTEEEVCTPREDQCRVFLAGGQTPDEETPISSLISQAEQWKKDSAVSLETEVSPILPTGVYTSLSRIGGVEVKVVRSIEPSGMVVKKRMPPAFGIQLGGVGKVRKVTDGCIIAPCGYPREKTGLLCGFHKVERESLVVKISGIKGAGFGLFTTDFVRPGESVSAVIAYGEELSRSEAMDRDYGLLIQLNDYRFIDVSIGNSWVKFVNDWRGSGRDGPNVVIERFDSFVDGRVMFLLIAVDTIECGGEILLDYGSCFWEGRRVRGEIGEEEYLKLAECLTFAG